MSRIPCFLFYDGDAARDVAHMNRLQRGAYFDILQAQLKFGHLECSLIQRILGNDYENTWEVVKIVLSQDDRSRYYINWVDESIKKRELYSKSRSNSAHKRWSNNKLKHKCTRNAHAMHTQYENNAQETETEEETRSSKSIQEREAAFKLLLQQYEGKYSKEMIAAFFGYWSEPNPSKTKMAFELKKTWEVSRRLATWASRDKIKPRYGRQEVSLIDLKAQQDRLLKDGVLK